MSSSRVQQVHAFNWIRNHLEEYPETSLPKQEVYDEYKSFCDNLNYHPLSAADFGKMMKNVFPNMKARRLVTYCYSGLRKRPFVHMPSLPTLDLHKTCDVLESPGQLGSIKEDVRFAACDLVCEWAQKVLKRQFDAVEDLARFLIDSHYISNKSLAALTIMTGFITQTVSAFVPTTEAQTFQPHSATLSSPSVDAKQQLQRKIQRKQQEQKLHSPLPGDGQTKRPDSSVPCGTPTPPLPPPTIGIVVTAVPSPITVSRLNSPLMTSSPVGTLESKVLPINFQMVTQPVKAAKPSPKPAQNIVPSAVGERTARQRYAQILPKPSAATAIALRSPSTMIITNNPVKTVMTSCHVSPVSLVKMTAISLPATISETTASLTNTAVCAASADVSSALTEDSGSDQAIRRTPAASIQTPMLSPGLDISSDVEMVNEDIHRNSLTQSPSNQGLTQRANMCRVGGAAQRAASVPIPQTKCFPGLEETCNGKVSLSIDTVTIGESSNDNVCETSAPSSHNASTVCSSLCSSRAPSFEESCHTKEGNISRKRSGLSPDTTPVKRVFVPQQSAEGAAGLGYISRPGAPVRPESAPVTREVEMKLNSTLSTPVNTLCTSSFRASGFYSVAKTYSSIQRKNISTVMETGTLVSHPLMQQHQGHTVANMQAVPNNPGFQKYLGVSSNSVMGGLEGQQQNYTESSPAPENLGFLSQAPSSGQLPLQSVMDYFHFDDDVTQDSIMEELVQMEEQMKLNRQQEFRSCAALQGQQAAIPDSMTSTNQTVTGFYQTANNSGNPLPSPTPTPTPTPEMMGGAQGLTGESPCSHIASTTPVDSALGSSRHTPAGTPHSNCSSTVPPSPVECRNPFAFTPINSSITGFHDGSTVSSSPVKPMQRPMATHPDKTRLEWMSNSYNSSGGSANKSNSGMGILPSYQGYQFQKPHAFAIPHARHHDSHFARLTPVSPVQQQLANMTRQEGFAVPAPLDNKTNAATTTFRCRSVSPAVHQRNLSGSTGNGSLSNVPRSLMSAFNPLATPEELSIFPNSQTGFGASSMAQRSRSVPLNIMMQTEVLPMSAQLCNSKNVSSVSLSKLDGDRDDSVRGVGINNSPSTYTARMNLTEILESNPDPSCTEGHLSLTESTAMCKLQGPNYLIENAVNDPMGLPAGDSQVQSHQQLDFSSSQEMLTGGGLAVGTQFMEQQVLFN
uniref:Regulatory factor X7a n=1 Tax=Salarias fasciatus TaxID=181472 RepID=A0A672I449_SALFA